MATDIKFGTDGWRGIIAWDFTFANVRRMAQALADYINENAPAEEEGKTSKIFVGYDRRLCLICLPRLSPPYFVPIK